MGVTVYRSTDPSAPVLDGLGGSLVNLLDKCLVAGYTGKAAAGWTKPFVGTNAAVFRQGGGNSFYLDVNDNGPGAVTTQEARLRGYEVMTAVATGTGPFPTVALLATGVIVRKSAAATATARVWTLIADDRTFYLFIQSGDTAGQWYGFAFGDFYSYVTGTDSYRTLIIGRTSENSVAASTENLDQQMSLAFNNSGHFVARSYTGLGGAVLFAKSGDFGKTSTSNASLLGNIAVPNPVDGSVWVAPVTITQTTAIRGEMRGFMHYLHTTASFIDQDTVVGSGAFAGRTFLLFKTTPNSGVYCIDITGPWKAN